LPQLLVILQVLVTQCQPVNPLRQHLFQTVGDSFRLAIVTEATNHPPQQVDLAIRLTKQQRTTLGAQPTALELGHYLARKMSFKWEESLVTPCH